MKGSEFYSLSKKYALLFKQFGLVTNDVVHIIVSTNNYILGVLGGVWMIAGICSLSDVSKDEEVIKHQVIEISLYFMHIFWKICYGKKYSSFDCLNILEGFKEENIVEK